MLAREPEAEFRFDELLVRSETGVGAEVGTGMTLTGHTNGGRTAEEARDLVGAGR
jgi:hypothetical protein